MIFSESWGYSERWFLRIGRDNQQKPPKSAEIMVTIRGKHSNMVLFIGVMNSRFPRFPQCYKFLFSHRMTVSAEFNQLEFRPARLAIAQGSMHWNHAASFLASQIWVCLKWIRQCCYSTLFYAILCYSMLPQVKMGHMMISHGVWGPQLWDIPRWT